MSSTIKLGDGMYCYHRSERKKKYQQPPRNDSLFVKQAINNITMNSKNVHKVTTCILTWVHVEIFSKNLIDL